MLNLEYRNQIQNIISKFKIQYSKFIIILGLFGGTFTIKSGPA